MLTYINYDRTHALNDIVVNVNNNSIQVIDFFKIIKESITEGNLQALVVSLANNKSIKIVEIDSKFILIPGTYNTSKSVKVLPLVVVSTIYPTPLTR